MDDDLIAAHGDVEALMPYLHLPVQSGSDTVLRAMNRTHDARGYLRTIERVRSARPDIAISGDFIVGFPGETAADFQATLELVREVGYASAFSFKYSRRPGTPASAMSGQVDEAAKAERLASLQELLESQRRRFDGDLVGHTTPVLIERRGRDEGQVVGRSPYLQAVHCQGGDDLIGAIVPVAIASVARGSLSGQRIAESV
jgi:tRNA-2-methylthio-N6-dimethylallyladenosine synthase